MINRLKRLMVTLQNKAVKIVAVEQRQDHGPPFYHQLQILKLKDLYVYKVAKLVPKNSQKKQTNRLNCHFAPVRVIHTRTTRLASYLTLICIYLATEHKNYRKVLGIKEPKFINWYHMNLKKLPLDNLNYNVKNICCNITNDSQFS